MIFLRPHRRTLPHCPRRHSCSGRMPPCHTTMVCRQSTIQPRWRLRCFIHANGLKTNYAILANKTLSIQRALNMLYALGKVGTAPPGATLLDQGDSIHHPHVVVGHRINNTNNKKNRQQAETTLTRSGQPTEAGTLEKEKGLSHR